MKKLLKFDIIHPREYLEKKKSEWPDLKDLSLAEYRDRLVKLRSNYSDYYTYYLEKQEGWTAEEFFLLDDDFLEKVAKESLGEKRFFYKSVGKFSEDFLKHPKYYQKKVVQSYIEQVNPDVIFVRSHPLPSRFWTKFRNKSLLVCRLSARMPYQWHPDDWDLIYTDLDVFKDFFEAHDVPTILNDQGFDQRINEEITERSKQFETTFIGGLGTFNFKKRTHFMQSIARQTDFQWWGYWSQKQGSNSLVEFPEMEKTFRGSISGLEMYQAYKDSKICLNDYVDTAGGVAFNQRMFEVMGVGSFLLTRQASNLTENFPKDIFITFENEEDCLDKIRYYLKNEIEREEVAAAAKKFIKENYNYERIAREFGKDCIRLLKEKNNLES